jgi:hypothetical protein
MGRNILSGPVTRYNRSVTAAWRTLVLFAIGIATACDGGAPPSSSVVGDWTGRVAPAHFNYLSVRVQQSGGRLTGTACYESNGYLAFRDAPVTINYPDVRVVVSIENAEACCGGFAGWMFIGKFTKEGLLDGYSVQSGQAYPMALERGGNLCANALRVPVRNGLPP